MRPPHPMVPTISGVPGHFRSGQIVDVRAGSVLSYEQFIERISSKDLIFVGEIHDNPDHHLMEVQIAQSIAGCCGPITLAMEFFEESDQPFLDQYLNGKLTESQFLDAVNWRQEWGFDYHFYRPLLQLAKQNRDKILAINAPYNIVRKVARRGLKGLEIDERNKLAPDIDLSNEAHRDYILKAYEEHEHGALENFEFFYEAQCVWEDTMAYNISKYLRENDRKVIAFAGNGHIINKFGIPDRAVKRFPVSMVTIMPYPFRDGTSFTRETADYIWVTEDCSQGNKILHSLASFPGGD